MIRVGTDCSGIEAPIQALRNLGIPFSHEFSSDIDKYCIQSIKANYEPKVLFGDPDGPFPCGDITTRDIADVPVWRFSIPNEMVRNYVFFIPLL